MYMHTNSLCTLDFTFRQWFQIQAKIANHTITINYNNIAELINLSTIVHANYNQQALLQEDPLLQAI